MADLKYTLDQARDRIMTGVGQVGIPNPWWPLPYGNDCIAFIAYSLGLRAPKQLDARFISISAFRDWLRQDPDWEEIPPGEARPGDILFENWETPRGRAADHAEWLYSGSVASGRLRVVSANTGPAPGVPEPRGAWRKYRDAGDWLIGAARPPYRSAAAAAPAKKRAEARLAGTWLNQQPELQELQPVSASDGSP